MNMRVMFMGVIANFTGDKEVALTFDSAPTLRGLLDELEQRYGPEFGARVFRTSSTPRLLQMYTRIFVNGHLVGAEELDKPVPAAPPGKPSSEVMVYLLPAACGG